MKSILNVMHLVKHYGDVKAVDGVTFFIEEGQVFGLLGPNGAGKTTTISIIGQILKPDSGKISICGYDLFKEGNAVKPLVGIVPQDLAIYPTLSARENLQFFGGLYGLAGKELNSRIDSALDFVGLADAALRQAKTYSGGMKRRLNLAAGLMNRPKLLILDEPAVGVDPQSRNHILESVKRLSEEEGTSILYTSHYMEEVQQICDRAAIIDHGKIIADNKITDLIDRYGTGMIKIELESPAESVVRYISEVVPGDGIRTIGNQLAISVDHPHKILPIVLEKLNANSVKIAEIEILRSNLEAVFLNLTGRSLRDE